MPYSLLDGLKVLELGGGLSAPYCGKLLADMGAQVIKIETPGTGDSSRQYGPFLNDEPHRERSGLYLYLNSNKQGITQIRSSLKYCWRPGRWSKEEQPPLWHEKGKE